MKSLVRNAWELLSILPLAACELHRVFQNQVHVDAQNPAPLKVADNIETLGHKPTIGNSEEGTYTAYLSPTNWPGSVVRSLGPESRMSCHVVRVPEKLIGTTHTASTGKLDDCYLHLSTF